jgi:hypothetical protein
MSDPANDSQTIIKKVARWLKGVMGGMGGAVVSEKSKTVPPGIGEQPFKDKPKKGVL